jgi:hypothetical protein
MTLQLWLHARRCESPCPVCVCMCVRQPTNSEHLELCLDVYISPITQSPEYEVQKQRIPLKIEGHSTRLVDNGLTVALNFEAESPVYLLHGYVRSRHSSHPPRCNKTNVPTPTVRRTRRYEDRYSAVDLVVQNRQFSHSTPNFVLRRILRMNHPDHPHRNAPGLAQRVCSFDRVATANVRRPTEAGLELLGKLIWSAPPLSSCRLLLARRHALRSLTCAAPAAAAGTTWTNSWFTISLPRSRVGVTISGRPRRMWRYTPRCAPARTRQMHVSTAAACASQMTRNRLRGDCAFRQGISEIVDITILQDLDELLAACRGGGEVPTELPAPPPRPPCVAILDVTAFTITIQWTSVFFTSKLDGRYCPAACQTDQIQAAGQYRDVRPRAICLVHRLPACHCGNRPSRGVPVTIAPPHSSPHPPPPPPSCVPGRFAEWTPFGLSGRKVGGTTLGSSGTWTETTRAIG